MTQVVEILSHRRQGTAHWCHGDARNRQRTDGPTWLSRNMPVSATKGSSWGNERSGEIFSEILNTITRVISYIINRNGILNKTPRVYVDSIGPTVLLKEVARSPNATHKRDGRPRIVPAVVHFANDGCLEDFYRLTTVSSGSYVLFWFLTASYTDHHEDVIKWKHFPRYWPFVRGIHRSSVNSPHKGQWRGASLFSLICAWINDWVNDRKVGDLRRYRAHYDVIVMTPSWCGPLDGRATHDFLWACWTKHLQVYPATRPYVSESPMYYNCQHLEWLWCNSTVGVMRFSELLGEVGTH